MFFSVCHPHDDSSAGSGGMSCSLSSPSSPDSSDDTKRLLVVPVARARLSTAAIKERILAFCKRATADYRHQVRLFDATKKKRNPYDDDDARANPAHIFFFIFCPCIG